MTQRTQPMRVVDSLKTRLRVEQHIEQLVEWVGPWELSVMPGEEKSERPYFGTRRNGRIVVKRKSRGPYPFSFTWYNVKSVVTPVAEREVRLVTGLTARAVVGYLAGGLGAAVSVNALLPGVVLPALATAALVVLLLLLLGLNRRCVLREAAHLRRAFEESGGADEAAPQAR